MSPAASPALLSLERFIPYRLSIASNALSGRIATTYETLFGLKIPEWRLITVLAQAGAASQQALGAATRMDKVAVSRAARALLARGLVARRTDARDARHQVVSLTPAGQALYREVAPKALEIEARVFADFTHAEREALLGFLARIEAAEAGLGDA